jgi:thymidylate synthase (FAD)
MSVELIGSLGNDLTIVNAARVSYAKRSEVMTERDEGLIRYLAKHRHGTPFEMVQFQFRVRCPIGVAREWFRHRIGSFNEQSTRYVEMQPDFYVPEPEHVRTQVGKAGHYTFEAAGPVKAERARIVMQDAYEHAYGVYQAMLEHGIAKELARNVLPLGLLTEFVWSVNLRSLFNFLSLRIHPSALLEIRLEAEEVERLIAPVVPVSHAAWVEGGRVSL